VVSAVLAVVVSFGCRLLVNLTAFWLLDVRGVLSVYLVGSNVLSGLIVPIGFFPEWLQAVARATPFPALVQIPVDIAVERLTGTEALLALGIQLAWAAGLLAAALWVLRRGTRRLVVQGG